MAGHGVLNSWAWSIVGDVPCAAPHTSSPPHEIPLPPPKVQQREKLHNEDSTAMPIFEGNDNPNYYLVWEYELNNIFASHFSTHKQVWAAVRTFEGHASIWWDEYCRLYPDYIPTTWDDLKLAMRYHFVPSSYTRSMLRKLQRLKQGSKTVEDYYLDMEDYLFRGNVQETEKATMNRFVRGLNREIQDILMRKEYYSINRLFRLACKAEQEIKRQSHEANRRTVRVPTTRVVSFASSSAASTKDTLPVAVRFTSRRACDPSPPTVPTSSDSSLQGNEQGTSFHRPHAIDISPDELNASGVELTKLPPNVIPSPIVADLNLQWAQNDDASAFESETPDFHESHDSADDLLSIVTTLRRDPYQLVAELSEPINDIKPSNDMNAPTALIDEDNESCDETPTNFGWVELVRHDEALTHL